MDPVGNGISCGIMYVIPQSDIKCNNITFAKMRRDRPYE